jgi:hypothetical protein
MDAGWNYGQAAFMERDLDWAAIVDVAERLNTRAQSDERPPPKERLLVTAGRKRSLATFTVTEGIDFSNLWTDGFEPVRRRRFFARRWTEIQSVAHAASNVGKFITQRPDLGGLE